MIIKSIVLAAIFIITAIISYFHLETLLLQTPLSHKDLLGHIQLFVIGILFLFTGIVFLFLWKCSHVRKQLTRELTEKTQYFKDQQARYKLLFNAIPEYIVLHDLDGTIYECNDKFSNILQTDTANFFSCFKENKTLQDILEKMDLHENTPLGVFTLKSNGSPINVDLISTLTEYDNKHAILTIVRDISEIKKMEQELYISQKNEAIGTLASGLSHDFKNILQNVKMYNQMTSKSDSLETVTKNASMIDNIVDSAFDYISNLLKLSKNKSEEYITVEVADEVKENVILLERIMPANISMSVFNNTGAAKINIVKGRFSQLIINLCINAKEAIGELEGEIDVLIERETVKMITFIKIAISDTGSGISDENMKYVFDPFYTTKGDDGTGLGLTMVRRAVRDFGGFITVDSKAGNGTVFNIYFPEHLG